MHSARPPHQPPTSPPKLPPAKSWQPHPPRPCSRARARSECASPLETVFGRQRTAPHAAKWNVSSSCCSRSAFEGRRGGTPGVLTTGPPAAKLAVATAAAAGAEVAPARPQAWASTSRTPFGSLKSTRTSSPSLWWLKGSSPLGSVHPLSHPGAGGHHRLDAEQPSSGGHEVSSVAAYQPF